MVLSGSVNGINGAGGAERSDAWVVFDDLPSVSCGSSYWGYLELLVESGAGGAGGQNQTGFAFRATSSPC